MVITFDSSSVAVIAYEILKNRLFDDKKLLGEVKIGCKFGPKMIDVSNHVANG